MNFIEWLWPKPKIAMFFPRKMHEASSGWYIENFGACIWFHLGKYVLRLGKPWGPYKYAWRPLFSFFRCFK
jgi:hypothetical protein